MDQAQKARLFEGLHVKGDPLILYNIWDAGSAKAVAEAGAKAIATGSWGVAAAQGYKDGEAIPLDFVAQIVRQITETVDLPVTVDFEGGYDTDAERVARNTARIIEAGAIGVNFEDRIVGGSGLFEIAEQCKRIGAMRREAEKLGIALFINARTDLFLQASDRARHQTLMENAKQRASAYRDAGASGFFAPALVDEALISGLCEASPLPVNILMIGAAPPIARLAELGVARVSFGSGPFKSLMGALTERAAIA